MPIVEISLVEGRTPQRIRRLITAVTDAVATSVGVPRDSIRVVVREVPAAHWAAGDVTFTERAGNDVADTSNALDRG